MTIYGTRGIFPIGTVIGWLQNIGGMDSLSQQGRQEWIECTGGTINDVESPLNGETLPDLNERYDKTGDWLRGASTSGTRGGLCTHAHTFTERACYANADSKWAEEDLPVRTDTTFNYPDWYQVVFIIRIK